MPSTPILIAFLSLFLTATACKKAPSSTAGAGEGDVAKPTIASSSDTNVAKPVVDAASSDAAASTDAAGSAAATDEIPTAVIPAAFVKFEALLLPLVREPESDARSAKTCKRIEELRVASLAVQRAKPAGVNETEWEAASKEMRGAFHGLGATCTDDPPNDSPDLTIIHKSYVRLLELLPE